MTTVAVLFPGEMGSAVACSLAAGGIRVVTCVEGRSMRTWAAAQSCGVERLPTLESVVETGDVVLSLVPQWAALSVARGVAEAARFAGVQPIFVDANSVSPRLMAEIASAVEQSGCPCVDGAFIGNASSLGVRTALYLSGRHAERAAALLAPGLPVRVLGAETGAASAFKLSVYGFNKGLVALFLEMICAADRIGLRDELLEHLRDFYPGSVATALRLLPTYPRHASRRVLELDEVVGWLDSIGQRADMAAATREVIAAVDALELPAGAAWDAESLLGELCRLRPLGHHAEPPASR